MINVFDHNPDENTNWKPNMASRVYRCAECGHEVTTTTNHTGSCYPICKGTCRHIISPNTARELVLPKQTRHIYVRERD